MDGAAGRRYHSLALPAAPSSPADAADPRLFRADAAVATRRGLLRLFSWLLAGDFAFVLIDQIEPRALPVVLRQHGASNTATAVIVSSIPSIMAFLVTPVVSYRSDRLRSRWGRRIPYLALAAPFVSLFLALTPFAPGLARVAQAWAPAARLLGRVHVPAAILAFGAVVLVYQFFKTILTSILFSLVRDVVPVPLLGRFMSLFRIVGALGTFVLTYWLLASIETRTQEVFVGLAIVNLVAFAGMCLFVREGTYPPVREKRTTPGEGGRLWGAIVEYCSESFTSPLYWWMYGARLPVYAAQALIGFLIFFPQQNLHLTLEASAKITAWPSLAWPLLAFPVGVLVDRWGAVRVFILSLWLNVAAYALSFFLVTGPVSFFVSSMATGLLFWMVMLTQMVFLQTLVHPDRFAQISSANSLVQSVVIALAISPAVGAVLDLLKHYHRVWQLPAIGAVDVGPYRVLFLVLAALFAAALVCARQARRHWLCLGGPDRYQLPK